MTPAPPPDDGYGRAGISDVRAFYRDKFLNAIRYDDLASGQDFRHHIDFAKAHWVLANLLAVLPAGARVLDVGCGCGVLNSLKAAGYEVWGTDLSPLNCARALANGYRHAVTGDVAALPWADGSFDAVVSLDLMGHIPFETKDRAVAEWQRVLTAGGIQLHGIECHPVDYTSMGEEALAAFVAVDGHVGVEGQAANEARFTRRFAHVASEFQFSIAMPFAEILKQHEQYPSMFSADPYLVNLLRQFTTSEVRAWNLAMGFVFKRLFDVSPEMPDRWGFLLLRASDRPLPVDAVGSPAVSRLLRPVTFGTLADAYHIVSGFHAREVDGGTGDRFRWSEERAVLLVPAADRYELTLGSIRLPGAAPAGWQIRLDGRVYATQSGEADREVVVIDAPAAGDGARVLEILATPFSAADLGGEDSRRLGVRLFSLDWR